jgi:Bacterial TniB protein
MQPDNEPFAHLHPNARALAQQADEDRIRYIRSEHWIGYPRAIEGVGRMEELLRWPKCGRMPNLLVVGPTNIGKTMMIARFTRRHPPVHEQRRERIPVVSIEMPATPSPSRFYTLVLDKIGAPVRDSARRAGLEGVTVRALAEIDTQMLIIDELHNILGASTTARHDFLNILRFLGNELRIPIIGVGTRDAHLLIGSDPQLENRFEPFVMPLWSSGPEMLSLLASFEKLLPLQRPSNIATEEMALYVLARSEGTIGEVSHLLAEAATVAIETGEECVNQRVLRATRYKGPSQRRAELLGVVDR